MQIFQTNCCKIITPNKSFDLQNESDEQFTDMKFLFSRYELKTINKRLVRGRNQSASEGKFMGSMAPYGYRAYILPGVKGNSLRIEPEEAKVVQMIYDMYGKQGISPTLASMITGPIVTWIFKLQMNGSPVSSGMGTCGFVGQIGVYTGWLNDIAAGTKDAITGMDWIGMLLVCFVLPAILSWVFCEILRKMGWIKEGDLKLDL